MSSRVTLLNDAYNSKSKYSCEKEWARHFARAYYHNVDSKPGFLTIYNQLLELHTWTQPVFYPGVKPLLEVSEIGETASKRITRSSASNSVPSTSALKNSVLETSVQQSESDAARAKYEFNRILHREYNNWYDAFEAEADEDADASADDRWSWHAAKVLSRKSGISTHDLIPVVQAWLLEKS